MAASKKSMSKGYIDSHPSVYRSDYDLRARKLALLGLSNTEIADIFGVSPENFRNWIANNDSFKKSLESGRDDADAEIAEALFHRAKGYSHPDVDIRVVAQGGNTGSRIEKIDVTKHYPPDTQAAIKWLETKKKRIWSNTITGADANTAALAAQAAITAALATISGAFPTKEASPEETKDE